MNIRQVFVDTPGENAGQAGNLPCILVWLFFVLVPLNTIAQAQGFEQVRELIQRGDFGAAVQACEKGLQKQPRDYQLWTLKGIALQGVAQNRESLTAFRRALTINPQFLPALQGAAQLEYQLRDPNCRKTLEALLLLRPEPNIYAMLGVLAFEKKDCTTALTHYSAAGRAASDPIIRWHSATCYFQLQQWEPAVAQFQALLAVKEDDRIRYNLGLAQVNGKQFVEAVATLQPLAQKAAPEADAVSLLATAHEGAKQLTEAFDLLRRAINLYPREERLYADLANLCLEHSAIDLGIEMLEVGMKNNPASARIQTMLGVLLARADRMPQAEAAFRRAAQLAPDTSFGRVGLAVAMLQIGAADEAIKQLRDQLHRTPNDAQVSLMLVQALLQKDTSPTELKEAHKILRNLLVRHADNARGHSLLGKIYLRQNDSVNAARALETAIKLDPSDRNSTYQLMTVYRKLGRVKEATALQGRVQKLLDEEREADVEAARYRLVRAPAGRSPQ
jgi:tetratricopeptide (TPR) repeat protein